MINHQYMSPCGTTVSLCFTRHPHNIAQYTLCVLYAHRGVLNKLRPYRLFLSFLLKSRAHKKHSFNVESFMH